MLTSRMLKELLKISQLKRINIILLILLFANFSNACDCIMHPLLSYYDSTSYISSVKVLDIDESSLIAKDKIFVTVEILKKFKGNIKEEQKIVFETSSDNCDFHFVKNKKYLLFYHKNDNYLVNRCSYSDMLRKSHRNMKKLKRKISEEKEKQT